MIVSINQPAYLPWLGYFERIAISDLHIALDHVQFEKNSFTNRNKIRTATGWTWLTVPVRTKGKFGNLAINEIEIDNSIGWHQKHWATITQSYCKTSHFSLHREFFDHVYRSEWKLLAALTREITSYLLNNGFQIATPVIYSSNMKARGTKSELVLDLCREVGATTYLSGSLGRNYLDETAFKAAGIAIRYHDYAHPDYKQAQKGFESHMGAIDLLFNHGPASRQILSAGQPRLEI